MNADQLEKHFTRMGGRIKVERPQSQPRDWRWIGADRFSLNIGRDRRGEHFLLTVPTALEESIQVDLLQLNAKQRHLLMLVKSPAEKGSAPHKDRFLCGHDEREWFVAAVPDAVSTISDAMESLKPEAVQAAQARAGLDGKQRQRRRNRAFKRQGEWFFLPVTDKLIDETSVLENEPITRSGGKPHWVQYLYREGGTRVYVCSRHPNGLTEKNYRQLIRRLPAAKGWGWNVRVINPRVLARGEIRHPDHKTVVLHDWHEVLMNRENTSRAMRNVDFID